MQINEYIQNTFPELELRPPLFYNWETGIRFELGVDYTHKEAYENSLYLQKTYKRAITLFKSLHDPNEDIYVAVDVNDYADGKTFRHKLKIFSPYIKEKKTLYKLKHSVIPYVFSDDNEDEPYKTHRFFIKCKTSDLKYIPMLKAICNHDIGIKPSLFHRVYFINIKRKTVFHVYDDRGCDLLAASTETIRDVYIEYNSWVLDYDREEIDKTFQRS